jgi:hypothetical protein
MIDFIIHFLLLSIWDELYNPKSDFDAYLLLRIDLIYDLIIDILVIQFLIFYVGFVVLLFPISNWQTMTLSDRNNLIYKLI